MHDTDAPAYRLLDGVAFEPTEHRFGIVIRRINDQKVVDPLTQLVVEINNYGACIETSPLMTDDLLGACSAAAIKPLAGKADKDPDFTADVTVPWTALNELFARPKPKPLSPVTYDVSGPGLNDIEGPNLFEFCYRELTPAMVKTAGDHVGMLTETHPLTCSDPVVVVYRESTKPNLAYQAGSENGNGSSQSSSGSSEPASLRRALAAGAGAASGSSTAASAPVVVLTAAQPWNAFNQISAEGDWQNSLLPSLSKQTNSTLSSVVTQQVAQQVGNLVPGGLGTSTSSTQFTKLDTDTIARLMPSAFRGLSDASTTLTNQPQAFDSTDALDLVPFNPTLINAITVGAKVTSVDLFDGLAPRLGVAGVAWFHDATRGASGSIVHFDQDLSSGLSIGISEAITNSATPSSNLYVAYPNPANPAYPASSPANPLLHSSNTVIGTLLKFGNGNNEAQPFQLFTRYATTGLGQDSMAALSSAEIGNGHPIAMNGTSLNTSLLGGYRAISYTYDPLFTTYNPFAGNQIYFGRANFGITAPKTDTAQVEADRAKAGPDATNNFADRSGTQTYSLSFAGIYAADGGVPSYGSFGVSPSIPLNPSPGARATTFSLTGSYLHSFMASTVYAREGGTVIVPSGPLNLLNNDTTSLSLQVANSDAFFKGSASTFTITAGVSALHYPGCTTPTAPAVPICSATFSHKVTWSINAGSKRLALYVDSEPGTTRTNPTSISPSIPSSQVVTTALIADHLCSAKNPAAWGAEPSVTYKNNIAQDGSVFQPGTLIEAGLDIGPVKGIKALGNAVISLTYQNAVNTQGTPVALKSNGVGFQLISASGAMWQAHKSKGDPCLQ